MPNVPDQQPDPLEKSLGDQATEADASGTDEKRSLGDQGTIRNDDSDRLERLDLADIEHLPLIDLKAGYEIEGELGEGGMGVVQLATERGLKRKVAIKRIRTSMAQSKTALQRFITEAQSIAALIHFNIVQIHQFARDAEGPLLVLEYVEGGSLLEKLKTGKLEIKEAVDITCQLCEGLKFAHEQGIFHRDIKPANILLTSRGEPKLTDFGLARQETADHGQTQTGAVLGTIDYIPPEQFRDATAVDARSDLYSLAATLYQMVTGKSPRKINFKNVPTPLQDILEKALEEEQDDRYQTAQEFRDALQDSLQRQDKPKPGVGVELREGECVECHTRNELSRKFCRECAAPLRVTCLACEDEIPVWEKICGECGGNQVELLRDSRAELDARRLEAESLRAKGDFVKAIEVAREILDVKEKRLQHQQVWAQAFINETEEEKKNKNAVAHQQIQKSFQEATKFIARGLNSRDYTSQVVREELISWQTAAEEGNRFAQWLLGDCYLEGVGVSYDLKAANTWFHKAAEAGLPAAQLTLCNNLFPRDKTTALSWLKRAVDQDYPTALFENALFELHKAVDAYPEAVELFQRAASLGSPGAEYQLFKCFDTGQGVEQDLEQAWEFLRKAAESGYVPAQTELAERLFSRNDHQDLLPSEVKEEAIEWLQRAANSNYPRAITLLEELNISSSRKSTVNSIGMELVPVSTGHFLMGSRDWHTTMKHFWDENPNHHVFLSEDLLVGKFPVTQNQYFTVMKRNPSAFKVPPSYPRGFLSVRNTYEKDMWPVEMVSWYDAVRFCNELSKSEDLVPYYEVNGKDVQIAGGSGYRLPYEAEWEFVARSGTQTTWWFGNYSDPLDMIERISEFAWCQANVSEEMTMEVGTKRPNWFGLFDMIGNVWEWCWDYYGKGYYSKSPELDPTGPVRGKKRVLRGGSFGSKLMETRPAIRESNPPDMRCDDVGFRVVRSV